MDDFGSSGGGVKGKLLYVRDVDGVKLIKKKKSDPNRDAFGGTRSARKSYAKTKSETTKEEHLLSKGAVKPKSIIRAVDGVVVEAGAGAAGRGRKDVQFPEEPDQLASVRFYGNQDDPPDVPLYATAYLKLEDDDEDWNASGSDISLRDHINRPNFSQPGAMPNFVERVMQQKVGSKR